MRRAARGVKLFRREHAKKDAARRAVAVAREHAVIDHILAGRERFEGGGAMDLVLRVHRRPALHEVSALFGFDEAGVASAGDGATGRRGDGGSRTARGIENFANGKVVFISPNAGLSL